jgi:hypothetical protein
MFTVTIQRVQNSRVATDSVASSCVKDTSTTGVKAIDIAQVRYFMWVKKQHGSTFQRVDLQAK